MKKHIFNMAIVCLALLTSCEEIPQFVLPVIETKEATEITNKTATLNAKLTVDSKDGMYARRAFEISTSKDLTSNDRIYCDDEPENWAVSHEFMLRLKNLSPATTYYYRTVFVKENTSLSAPIFGEIKSFTTLGATPGSSLTVADFTGTYTVSATSPWENKTIKWTDVQIIPYNGDTVVAVGWEDRDELRAVGIFDKELQVVRFESGWYFEAYSFTVNGKTCAAVFSPVWYNSKDSKAYLIHSGGKHDFGEIWLTKTSTGYAFEPCAQPSDDNYYANGIIFDYYSVSDWVKQANSQVYTELSLKRTATTTNRYTPARKHNNNLILKTISDENRTKTACSTAVADKY